jgi:hypothetical protein
MRPRGRLVVTVRWVDTVAHGSASCELRGSIKARSGASNTRSGRLVFETEPTLTHDADSHDRLVDIAGTDSDGEAAEPRLLDFGEWCRTYGEAIGRSDVDRSVLCDDDAERWTRAE